MLPTQHRPAQNHPFYLWRPPLATSDAPRPGESITGMVTLPLADIQRRLLDRLAGAAIEPSERGRDEVRDQADETADRMYTELLDLVRDAVIERLDRSLAEVRLAVVSALEAPQPAAETAPPPEMVETAEPSLRGRLRVALGAVEPAIAEYAPVEQALEPPTGDVQYEGTVRLNVQTFGAARPMMMFLGQLSQNPQLRVLRMEGSGRFGGVDVALSLMSRLPLKTVLRDLPCVRQVTETEAEVTPSGPPLLSVHLEGKPDSVVANENDPSVYPAPRTQS